MRGPVLVCYDVFEDGRRARLREALAQVADRFQQSGWLIPGAAGLDAGRAATALEGLLAPADRLRIYAPCPACALDFRVLPHADAPLDPAVWVAQ